MMPWPVSCVEVNFHIETESSETNKVFIRRKRVPMDRHTGGESRALMEFESLSWGIPSPFPLASHLASPGSESILG